MTKILLVEDDKSLREIYSVRLLAEGYTVVSAEDGERALAEAMSEKPDLIVSDVMMPKISGFEMLDLLRNNESTKNIKVIMLTALSSEQQRERGDRLGADRYLVKSQVGIEDIVRTVHEVLGDQGNNRTLSQMENSTKAAANAQTEATAAEQQSTATINSQAGQFNTQYTDANSANMPAVGQSPFNPLAATAPASVAGQPTPTMPNQPMSVPAYTNQPPIQTATYSTAMQAAVNAAEQLNKMGYPTQATAAPATFANTPTNDVGAAYMSPEQIAAYYNTQAQQSSATAQSLNSQNVPQWANTQTPMTAQNTASVYYTNNPYSNTGAINQTTAYNQPIQPDPEGQQALSSVFGGVSGAIPTYVNRSEQNSTQETLPPAPVPSAPASTLDASVLATTQTHAAMPAPTPAAQADNVTAQQNPNESGPKPAIISGERVIQPPAPQSISDASSPKIDINALLNGDNGTASASSPLFPAG